MARLALLCVATLLSTGVIAGPLKKGQLSSDALAKIGTCDEKDNLYQPGNTYEYQYFGKVETGLGFGDSKSVGLAVDCRVELSVPEACEYRMKVRSCELLESEGKADDENEEGFRTLEEEVSSLRGGQVSRLGYEKSGRSAEFSSQVAQFAIQAQIANGEIQRVIYEDEEPIWVLNFKKAILDALHIRKDGASQKGSLVMQNTVQGLCPTKFGEETTADFVVEKKDIDACIQRSKNQWQLSPLSPIWNMSALSIAMDSKSICAYQLQSNSGVQSMICREVHRFLPLLWSEHVAVATANLTQTLRLVATQPRAEQMDRSLTSKTITSILYEHENATDVDRKPNAEKADDLLQALVQQTIDGVDLQTPATFDDFVNELRSGENHDEVLRMVRQLQGKEKDVAKYYLVQGLVQCNTPAAIQSLTTLMQTGEIPEKVFGPVIMALAMRNKQDPLFLNEIRRICELKPTRSCTLMIGALSYKLVNEFEDIMEERETAEPIKKAAQFIVDLLDGNCEPSDVLDRAEEQSEFTKVILALKAIGNLGNVAQKIEEATLSTAETRVLRCLEKKDLPSNVTIAAIEALRRFQPTRQTTQKLLSILESDQFDHEVRMTAGIAAIRAAGDKETIRRILAVAETEQSDHVKSFIVSVVRGIQKSEDPYYKEIAQLVKEVLLEKGQKLPEVKARIPQALHFELSKFYQVPFLDDEENDIGAQVEGCLMFTPKSYLPKLVRLNASVELWGDYVNVLETGIRMQGIDDLVEKVIGPNGVLSNSKLIKKAKTAIVQYTRLVEDIAYKYLRLDNVKDAAQRLVKIFQSQSVEQLIDQIFRLVQSVDTEELRALVSRVAGYDAQQVLSIIRKSLPQSEQLVKIAQKLQRVRIEELSEEQLIEIMESAGISRVKVEEIFRKVAESGVEVDQIIGFVQRLNLRTIQSRLAGLRVQEVQRIAEQLLEQARVVLRKLAEKYNMPDVSSAVSIVKDLIRTPSQLWEIKEQVTQMGRRMIARLEKDEDSEEEFPATVAEEEDADEDQEMFGQSKWSNKIRSLRRQINDDREADIQMYLRVLGDELGFVSLNDIKSLLNVDWSFMYGVLSEDGLLYRLFNGEDFYPTIAGKMEGVHHISTGLGLPLQVFANMTGVATAHIKMQIARSAQSFVELEPSAAIQIATGIRVDIPSIHSIATVSNTTVSSETEIRMQISILEDGIDVAFQKPAEELDLFNIRQEIKLVKDEEEFEPFGDEQTEDLQIEKCLPTIVEQVTGLRLCAAGLTSKFRNVPLPSHGPHQLRISIQESEQDGFDSLNFAVRRNQQPHQNRFEMRSWTHRSAARQPQSRRESQLVVLHDRHRHNIDMMFNVLESSYPKLHFFARNKDDEETLLHAEVGFYVEYNQGKHYNASVTVVSEASKGAYAQDKIWNIVRDSYYNYTLKGSVQTPVAFVNVSTTTAKIAQQIFMEHNLTYWVSEDVQAPLLSRLPIRQRGDEPTKFTLRHGLKVKSDYLAHDLRAFVKLLAFPTAAVAEPIISHVAQLKLHRDYRQAGLHFNTSLINQEHELEFLNVSLTANYVLRVKELGASMVATVSRNDWSVSLNNQLNKVLGGYKLRQELVGQAQLPTECQDTLECARLALSTCSRNLLATVKGLKSRDWANRPHEGHHVRKPEGPVVKIAKIVFENTLKEKIEFVPQAGLFADTVSQEGSRVYVLSTSYVAQGIRSRKEFQCSTVFGNNAADQGALLSLFVIHNTTSTSSPIKVNHFQQLLVKNPISRGIVYVSNSTIKVNQRELVALNMGMQAVPQTLFFKSDMNVDSALLDMDAQLEVSKPVNGLFEVKMQSKIDGAGAMEAADHQLSAKLLIQPRKVYGSVELQHVKLQIQSQGQLNLLTGELVEESENEYSPSSGRSLAPAFTVKKLKQLIRAFNPELIGSLVIRSPEREVIPNAEFGLNAAKDRFVLTADIKTVPRAVSMVMDTGLYQLVGRTTEQMAELVLTTPNNNEITAEARLQDERKVNLKLSDRGVLRSGESLHAQLTLELPTESRITAKFFVDEQNTQLMALKVQKAIMQTVQIFKRVAEEKSQAAARELKRIWIDERHPVYALIRPYASGSLQEIQQRALLGAQKYIIELGRAIKTAVEQMDVLEMVNLDKAMVMRKGREIMYTLAENDQIAWAVEQIPSLNELLFKVERVMDKYFPRQSAIIRSRKNCLTMKTCDLNDALRSLQEAVVEVYKTLGADYFQQATQSASEITKDLIVALINKIEDQANRQQWSKDLLKTIDCASLKDAIQMIQIPDFESLVEILQTAGSIAKSVAVDKINALTETQDGSLVVKISHPFRWNSFKEIPRLNAGQQLKLQSWISKAQANLHKLQKYGYVELAQQESEGFNRLHLDSLKKFARNGMSYQTAMVFADKYVMTFDGKVYAIPQAAGQACAHLLARGAGRPNFALIKEQNAITLSLPEITVTVDYNNKVRLNESGVETELPVESYNRKTQVKLIGDTVVIESTNGITVEIKGEERTVLVHVSAGLWDTSIGLLGTNDNEADNDFELPSGQLAQSVESFVNAFELSQGAACQSRPARFQQRSGNCGKSSKCATVLRNQESALSPCFSVIDPSEFLEACEEESKKCERTEAEKSVCEIVGAYRAVCSAQQVQTDAPEACETCDGRKENSQWSVSGNQDQVDVVILVSESKEFLRKAMSPAEKIQQVADAVTRKLTQVGGKSVRVALAAFGGAGVHRPGHSHTIEGKQFGRVEELPEALQTLQFRGAQESDVLDAIEFVLESHDFRPEASKLMLVFTPSESEYIAGHSRHYNMKEKLLERGVTVTVFSSYDELKERHVGINFDGSIFAGKKVGGEQTGEMPEMKLSRLAKGSRGAVFQLDALIGSDNAGKAETAAEAILRQVLNESRMCKTCVCQQTELKQLVSACRITAC